MSVRKPWGKGHGVKVFTALVDHEEESTSHFVAAQADCGPCSLPGGPDAEEDIFAGVVRDGEGEGDRVIRRDECRLTGGVIRVGTRIVTVVGEHSRRKHYAAVVSRRL